MVSINNFDWLVELYGNISLTLLEDTETTGSIVTTAANKKSLAIQSREWNRKQPVFIRIFPELLSVSVPQQTLVYRHQEENTEQNKQEIVNQVKENMQKESNRYLWVCLCALVFYLVSLKLSFEK